MLLFFSFSSVSTNGEHAHTWYSTDRSRTGQTTERPSSRTNSDAPQRLTYWSKSHRRRSLHCRLGCWLGNRRGLRGFSRSTHLWSPSNRGAWCLVQLASNTRYPTVGLEPLNGVRTSVGYATFFFVCARWKIVSVVIFLDEKVVSFSFYKTWGYTVLNFSYSQAHYSNFHFYF